MTIQYMDEQIKSIIESVIYEETSSMDGSVIHECHPWMENPHPWMTSTDEDDR